VRVARLTDPSVMSGTACGATERQGQVDMNQTNRKHPLFGAQRLWGLADTMRRKGLIAIH
jgi:hypothetical protein